ncbi:GNAT family N-acetyltransferase [Psychromarinibacter sp. S121]|uniref:GNAT family N-acetyltransferase n=1 Tax=Psychromarinibacter sp. S121 TaxID=3415127 RepID=UPI003C7BB285
MIPTLDTPRLILRGHRPDDFAASAAMWADPAVVRFIQGTPQTAEQSWQRFLRYAGHWAMVGYGYWVAEAKADGRFVGEIGFADYRRDLSVDVTGIPEAGWVLATHAHGKGLATEAMQAALGWIDRRYPRTFALFDPAHAASMHVARKLGFGAARDIAYNGQPAVTLWRDGPRTGAAPAGP